jgi:hypothetical protein
MTDPWSVPVRLVEVGRHGLDLSLEADEAQRGRIAAALGLPAVHAFTAKATLKPWLDGVELVARWRARVAYTCGITLEPFDSELSGEFTVRAVPEGSPNAPAEEAESVFDLEAEDPPDVLAEEAVDVGDYLVEHLALELDPFPRKPGAVFEPPPAETPASPFAVLRDFKPKPN